MEDQEFLKRAKIITEALEGVEYYHWAGLANEVERAFHSARAHATMTRALAERAYGCTELEFKPDNSTIHATSVEGNDDTINGFEVAAYTSRLSAHPATDASHMPLPDIQP